MSWTSVSVRVGVSSGQDLAVSEQPPMNADGAEPPTAHVSEADDGSLNGTLRELQETIGCHVGRTHTSIIEGVRLGIPEAQVRFERQYRDPIRAYFAAKGRRGWGINPTDAGVVACETIEYLCVENRLRTYDRSPRDRDFRRYLFPILYRRAVDFINQTKRNPAVPNADPDAALAAASAEQAVSCMAMPDSELACIVSRRRMIIASAIEMVRAIEKKRSPEKGLKLPFDVDIFVQHVADGQPYKDIDVGPDAELTYDAVKSRARAGKLRLREAIREVLRAEGKNEQQIDDTINDLLDTVDG